MVRYSSVDKKWKRRYTIVTELTAYISFDPGEHTGWATFDNAGRAIDHDFVHGRQDLYELLDHLEWSPIKHVIIEDFFLFPWKAKEQGWSDFETARVIGVLQDRCYLSKTEYTMQPANFKPIAYKWAGMTVPKNKLQTHAADAYVHGVYYLQKLGVRTPQQGRN
jgi:hypothetical protein